MSDELKPCPFCGHRAKLSYYRVAEDAMVAKVFCPGCLAQTGEFEDASAPVPTAIEAWNRRTPQPNKETT